MLPPADIRFLRGRDGRLCIGFQNVARLQILFGDVFHRRDIRLVLGYRLAIRALSKSICDPYSMQKAVPVFWPVFTDVGTAISARRIPPSALPISSRAICGRSPMVNWIGGALGGGVPFLIQTTK